MTKRSAPSSPIEQVASKKKKLDKIVDTRPATLYKLKIAPDSSENNRINVAAKTTTMDIDTMVAKDTSQPQVKGKSQGKGQAKVASEKKKTPKKPPVIEGFTKWTSTIIVPDLDPSWGIKPVTSDSLPRPDQPSARDSDAATNPPMWEDRKFRYKRGSRYVKYFGPIAPEDTEDGPDLDQEDLLVLKLIDMRPISKHNQSPRRKPVTYCYDHGKPNDWNNMQSIKALNDRRGQAIDRITLDAPWSRVEREYLAGLLCEYPDASIWELTMRHNDRFKDKESAADTAFSFSPLSSGRTVESVRHQYMTYKPAYDRGEAPERVRFRNDNSLTGKAIRAAKSVENAFGKPSKVLEKEFDEHSGDGDDGEVAEGSCDEDEKYAAKELPAAKKTKKVEKAKDTKALSAKFTPAIIEGSENEGEPVVPIMYQPKLSPHDEEIFIMAGGYDQELIGRTPSSPYSTEEMPEAVKATQTLGDASASQNDEDETSSVIETTVSESGSDIVDQVVQYAEQQKQAPGSQNVDVSLEVTQDNTTTTDRRTSLRAVRRISLDENYDDDFDEL